MYNKLIFIKSRLKLRDLKLKTASSIQKAFFRGDIVAGKPI